MLWFLFWFILPEFAATTEAKYVTIPFAAMQGKNGGVFDPTNISSFGIWCNTISPEGAGNWNVDSVIYVDDIHAVTTDSAAVEYLDTRINSDGSAGSQVETIRTAMEKPLLWYGPGYEGMKSLEPEPVTVTTLYQGTAGGKYETSDPSWLLNGKDTDYVTFVYNCSDMSKAGWSVLGWGATVNGTWTDGPRYNAANPNALQDTTIMVSVKELKSVLGIEREASVGDDWVEGPKYTAWKSASREYAVSYTVKRFKELLGVTPERPLTYIKLGSYNDGRIVRLSLDDTKTPFVAFYSWADRHGLKSGRKDPAEQPYTSPYAGAYRRLIRMVGNDEETENVARFAFSGEVDGEWDEVELDGDSEAQAQAAAAMLKPGSYIVIKYESSEAPVLLPQVDDYTYNQVTAAYSGDGYAVYLQRYMGANDSTYQVLLSDICPGFGEGDTVKITVDFNKNAKVKFMLNNNEEEIINEEKQAQFVMEKVFTGGQISVQAADSGDLPLKLMNITAEIVKKAPQVESIHTFTKAWGEDGDTYSAKLSEFCSDYAVGDTVEVTARFNKESQVKFMMNSNAEEEREKIVTGTEFTFRATPTSDNISIQAGDESRLPLKLLDVQVTIVKKAPVVEALHTFTKAWGADEDTYSAKLSAFCSDYAVGDTVKITARFDKESQVKFMLDSDVEKEKEQIVTGTELTFDATPTSDKIMIQAGDESKLPLKLLDVQVKITKKAPVVEALHTFTNAWGSGNDQFTVQIKDYCSEFKSGNKVKVIATFDKDFQVKLMGINPEDIIDTP